MRQQTKSFFVEWKPSSKLKPDANKPSIWENLDLTLQQDPHVARDVVEATTAGGNDDRH